MGLSLYSNALWHLKCVEPIKRKVGGIHGWAIHRFPIKSGISIREAMIFDMLHQSNPLLKLIEEHKCP